MKVITSKRKIWIDILRKEKIGSADTKNENPMSKAITTLVAFNLVGLIPLIPFILGYVSGLSTFYTLENIFIYSAIFTGFSFFAIGLFQGRVVNKSPLKSGLNTLMIGGIAAIVSFIVGDLLSNYVR